MNLNTKRFLAAFLSLVMLFAAVPSYALGVFAAEEPYRTVKQDGDEMSLTSGDTTYYFDTVGEAFAAVENAEVLNSNLTLTLLANSEYELTKTTKLFTGYGGTVTLDINGKSLTFKAADGATSRYAITPQASLILTDNTASGKADEGTLNSGSIFLVNTYFSFSKTAVNIKNVNLEASGGNGSSAVIIGSSYRGEIEGYIENSKFTFDSNLQFTKPKNTACISITASTGPINIEHCNFVAGSYAGIMTGSASLLKGTINLNYNIITAENGTAIAIGGGHIVINNEEYKVQHWANVSGAAEIEVYSGVFYGDILNTASGASIAIQGGIFENDPSRTQGVTYSGCTKETIADGEYSGWTKFSTGLKEYSATINKGEYGGALTVEKGGKELFDLDTVQVYGSEETTYTLTLLPGFSIKGISITAGKKTTPITLDETGGYKVIDNTTSTLTIMNPESDYTLNFTIQFEQGDGAIVASIGDKTYTSVIAAFADVKAGETVTLEQNIECASSITIKLENLALDLNGKTLLFSTESYGFFINGGGLTVKDTNSEQTGSIDSAGITLDGSNSEFELQSGMLWCSDANKSTIISSTSSAKNAVIKVSGGKIYGQINGLGQTTNVIVSDGEIVGGSALRICGSLTMTGGEVRAEKGLTAVKLDLNNECTASITGGRIIASHENYAIYIQDGVGTGNIIIGGDADIISTDASAFHIGSTIGRNTISITISDQAHLSGKEYALEIDEKDNKPASIIINGGYYKFGKDYLAISNTYYVTYPEGMVMNTRPEETGAFAGYYTLATKESLGGHNDKTDTDYTYQDYAGNYPGGGLGGGLDDILAAAKVFVDA